jgi:hypothetical protein
MRPMKSLFLSLVCTAALSIEYDSVAAGDALQKNVSAKDFTLADNVVSAEQTALNEIENAVRQTPAQAPDIVTKALRTEVPHPIPTACEVVRAAIAGFGERITRIDVARTVYAAIHASPEETLGIVGVAIADTRPALHKDVVGAAIAAVPDPYACVSPDRLRYIPCNPDRTPVPNRESMPIQPEPCDGPTLAEAILQEAILAGAVESEFAINPEPDTGALAYDALITKTPPGGPTPPPTPPPISP